MAMEDAVAIANAVHDAIAAHPNKKPTDREIHDVLQNYQETRIDRVKFISKLCSDLTRFQAYDGWKSYLTQRWLTPLLGLEFLAKTVAGVCVGAPKLKYVKFDEQRGILGWDDTREAEKAVARKAGEKQKKTAWDEWSGDFESVSPNILGVLLAVSLAIWVFLLGNGRRGVPGFGRVDEFIGASNATAL